MLDHKPEHESPAATAQVRAAFESPRLAWLPGFRSGTWWKRIVASAVYLVLALIVLIDLLTGNGGAAVVWALVLGVVVVAPVYYARGRTAGRGALKAFRVTDGMIFPHGRFEFTEDRLHGPWPGILKRLAGSGEHLVFVPLSGGMASEFATEARVVESEPLVVVEGLRRVRVTKTAGLQDGTQNSVGRGLMGLFFAPGLLFRLVPSARPTNVPTCSFTPLDDNVDDKTAELASKVRSAFLRWAADHPRSARLRKAVEGVDDPLVIAGVVCQELFGLNFQGGATLLMTDDVSYRLRACLNALQPNIPDLGGERSSFPVEDPDQLPTLADIGGMEALKKQIRETLGVLIENASAMEQLRVNVNGVLLHGPPGTGKTTIARATAGEYKMSFLHLTGGDLTSKWMGETEKKIQEAFATAVQSRPCLLLLDEFDSIAGKRGASGNEQFQSQVVGQLLRSLEAVRREPGVIVMAATNDVEALDPAVVRPGRFDFRIRVDLPDGEARRAIFEARLRGLPAVPSIPLDSLVADTQGRSAAFVTAVVEAAKLKAVERAVREGAASPLLDLPDLELALLDQRGKDAPTLSPVGWDELILPERTKAELQSLARLIADPRGAREMGVDPPRGALLYGAPGTGKTTVARAIATELKGRVSFLPAKGSDLVSKFVGEGSKNLKDLFDRAREGAPAIIFIDELEALLPKRGQEGAGPGGGADASLVTEFLQQLDGIDSTPGVFVLGATNLPDKIDPAVLRGGRLGRRIEIPLPNEGERRRLFELHTRRLQLEGPLDVASLTRLTERLSGADIEAVCQDAAAFAYERAEGPRAVTQGDFEAVLRRRRRVARVERRDWSDLILPEETLGELRRLAGMIANPAAAIEFGLKPPTGALLYGPPGTGKTTIAQVLASQLEGDVGFISAKGSDLVSKWVGESAKKVAELFERARAATPTIIFIDEIDALLPARRSDGPGGGEQESVVTEFLQQLDGIDSTPGVFVLGATNLPDRVDPAIRRGGRLGREIEIPLPTPENRRAMLEKFTGRLRVGPDLDLERLAVETEGMSGADIESLCASAAENAFMNAEGPRQVGKEDLLRQVMAWRRRRGEGRAPVGV
ncbi:MAG: AAA family ATPase [Candidatus Dormibacteraceae bacterium]